ncbi:MAG: hypothetical protein J1E37_05240 [Prevotella sp.]|nr:hypothetical protein [Prevotella sp.]
MTCPPHTCCFASRLAVSLLLLVFVSLTVSAQKFFRVEKDSIPFFRGFAVSFDLVGPAMLTLSDHGEYEGALRLNLHDQWFPTFELGIGRANHEKDEVTGLSYKTTAPYFRLGMDWNVMKNKHLANRIYAGFRYAFTAFKADFIYDDLPDPIFQTKSGFSVEGVSCSQHWVEAVFGIDAQIYGPMHLGWTIRYLRRLGHKEGDIGQAWYVPGFGINDKDNFVGNFNIIIDI